MYTKYTSYKYTKYTCDGFEVLKMHLVATDFQHFWHTGP